MDEKCTTTASAENDHFEIHWRQLGYTVHNSSVRRFIRRVQGFKNIPKSKKILENVTGCVRKGELVAFVGPSGAGKSTLMECIVGRRVKGRTGHVFVGGKKLDNIKVAFIAQKTMFLTKLTVRETIYFAAQIHIATKSKNRIVDPLFDLNGDHIKAKNFNDYCRMITDRIICELNLNSCENTRVNHCSGGELKRLAIAQELIGKPQILLLDEPTSGLDSSSTYQVIRTLRSLCESDLNLTVFASIHQPSYKVLNLFHKLYAMSSNGDLVYGDSPSSLVDTLKFNGLICSSDHNPAELLIEVASGEHGTAILDSMVKCYHKCAAGSFTSNASCKPLDCLSGHHTYPTWSHICIIAKRQTLITVRDPVVFGIRCFNTLALPLFLVSLYGTQVGVRGGCPPQISEFEPLQLHYIKREIDAEIETTRYNTANMAAAIMFTMFNSMMSTLLSFPREMIVFKNEKKNHWYSNTSFFYGRTFSESPLQLILTVAYWPLQRVLQHQIPDFWRLSTVTFAMLMVQFISQAYGYIIGAVFMYHTAVSVFFGPSTVIIIYMLLCGAFVKVSNLSPFFYALSYLDYVRLALETSVVSLYGFDRCAERSVNLQDRSNALFIWLSMTFGVQSNMETLSIASIANTSVAATIRSPSEMFVRELVGAIVGDFFSDSGDVRSVVMNRWQLEDWHLYRSLISLIVYLIVLRIIAYLIMAFKVSSKN